MRKYSQIWRCFTLALYGMLHGIELFKNLNLSLLYRGFPGVKNPPAMQETWFDPFWGRSPGEGNSNALHYSCLETPWTEEAVWLQSTGSQNSQTLLND